jgi:hypothetical protein
MGAVVDSALVDEIHGRHERAVAPDDGHDNCTRSPGEERVVAHAARHGMAQRRLVGARCGVTGA